MKIKLKIILLITLTFFIGTDINSDVSKESFLLDKQFYSKFSKIPIIRRDAFLNGLQNEILQGRGYIESVERLERYRRGFRIIVIDSEAQNFNVRFYIFTNNEEYLTLLKKGDLFDFKGQFIIHTPLSSRRDSYIFDIILEDGALIVK